MIDISLAQQKSVAIYGLGDGGIKARKWLEDNHNICVKYYIDSFSFESSFDGLPLFNFSKINNDNLDVDSVVIASVENFNSIALGLANKRIPYIRWLPVKSYYYKSDVGNFAYKPIPKVANTSIKELIWKLNFESDGSEGETDFHCQFIEEASIFYNGELGFKKIALVREPISRFVSAFVHCCNDLNYFNGSFSDDINAFIKSFHYLYLGQFTHVHFCPQFEFLGSSPQAYDKIYNMSDLHEFYDDLAVDGHIVERKIRNSSSSKKIDYFRRQLNSESIDFIKKLYLSDIEIYGRFFK